MSLADYFRLVRTLTQEQVDEIELERSSMRGRYVSHGGEVHHTQGESRH